MKKFTLLLCLALSSVLLIYCSNDVEIFSKESSSIEKEIEQSLEIGSIENGKINSFFDSHLIESWEKRLAKEGFGKLQLQNPKIVKKINNGNSEDYYILVAANKERTTVSAIFLEEKNGVLSIPDMQINSNTQLMDGPKTTVTCTGCSYGCDPEKTTIDGKDLYSCSSGCGSNCTKTVSTVFEDEGPE